MALDLAIVRAPVTASERDLRTLLGIVADDRCDPPPDGLPWSLLADLMDLVRCDAIAFLRPGERPAGIMVRAGPARR
jgi:hypothetical protein